MKIGQKLYSVGPLDGDGKIEWDEYIVRTIRGGKVFATCKNSSTWGKVSKHHGDFGWLDPVHSVWRKSWRVDEDIPSWFTIATTRKGALKLAIAQQKKWGSDEDYDDPIPGRNDRIVKTLESMLKRERKPR